MLKKERQNRILHLLDETSYLTIVEIATQLEVSEMTIRRDVTELAKENKLKKLYGGAEKLSSEKKELSTQEKIYANIEEKKYIGKVMNEIIKDNSTVFVGAGTTILYALQLINRKNLFFITNSLIAFMYLKENTDYRIILTGGEFSHVTEEFVGEVAVKSFENLNIDIAFAATNGIVDNNVTTAQFVEGSVQIAALAKAKIKCIVADSSKLDVSDIYTFYNLSEFDYLITDEKISDDTLNHYSQYTTILKEHVK
ncbi:DeoR/GlpR family DNA-binding transcription regulator [Trichococcus sp. K1Tr]|uniref:DeoR/GlpR family DNA-binding transcription regulator n=1 Tax=Trichococcus sp. K1Tr TaxID=3020847 RepID=UPI0023307E58|nr:DeoR/GlpR family DNA-binding transcription regulator [Trichococcus sp. K1Tr]MDB6353728.1 DeoR/GlpR family DNA-binding transcription regulator [Trichococcus sp. K1Tr]